MDGASEDGYIRHRYIRHRRVAKRVKATQTSILATKGHALFVCYVSGTKCAPNPLSLVHLITTPIHEIGCAYQLVLSA